MNRERSIKCADIAEEWFCGNLIRFKREAEARKEPGWKNRSKKGQWGPGKAEQELEPREKEPQDRQMITEADQEGGSQDCQEINIC